MPYNNAKVIFTEEEVAAMREAGLLFIAIQALRDLLTDPEVLAKGEKAKKVKSV
jgi:hypothetical protein